MSMFDTITNEDIINGTEDFALVHTIYTNTSVPYSETMSEQYHIHTAKIENGRIISGEECYDNVNYYEEVIMSREEMLMNFTLIFGKTVNYEIEYECDGSYSNLKLKYMGKMR